MESQRQSRRADTARKARLAASDHWGDLLKLRDRQRERIRRGIQVIEESDLPLETSSPRSDALVHASVYR